MKHYLLATQREWGVKVFEILKSRGGDWWLTRTVAGLRASITPNVRYVFCVNFSSYVPPDVLVSVEIINFHVFGSGPIWHRGGGPIENLLLRGYTETLIWAHRMTNEIDAGPVFGSRGPVSLGPVRYIAKPGTWFMTDSAAQLVDDYRPKMQSGLFRGSRRCEKPYTERHMRGAVYTDEEVCGFDEFEIRPSCTKTQILDRFVDPVVELIRWIVAEEPEPYPQVGEVVTFSRLPKDAYEKFWRERHGFPRRQFDEREH